MRTVKLTQPDAWRHMPPAFPSPLRTWLTDRGSLTARVVRTHENFSLRRVSQGLAAPLVDEYRAIGLRRGEHSVVREVVLCDGRTPLVFAHSVVARGDLRGAWRGLSRLGARPLAEMLFADPLTSRRPMEYRQLDSRHALYLRAQQAMRQCGFCIDFSPRLWARRSVFLKHGRGLLVTEVFLTSLPK